MIKFILKSFGTITLIMILGCSYPNVSRDRFSRGTQSQPRKPSHEKSKDSILYGKASYYGPKFHGRKTANGEVFNQYDLTAAHKTLPFGTVCKVINLDNGKSVIVRINDRGPFIKGRILDLSYGAAKRIDGVIAGVMNVKIEILKYGTE